MAETKHETNIEITGSSTGAESAFKNVWDSATRLVSVLNTTRSVIASVSRALGVFWLAWNGIQLVITGWQKLNELLSETRRKMEEIRLSNMFDQAADSAAVLIGRIKEINNLLDIEAKRAATARQAFEIEDSARRDAEDSRREVSRAEELAGVTDPRARQVILDRFAAEDEKRRAEASRADTEKRIQAMNDEADMQRRLIDSSKQVADAIAARLDKERALLDELENAEKPNEKLIEGTKDRIKALEDEGRAAKDANSKAREALDAANAIIGALENSLDIARTGAASAGTTAGAINRSAAWRAKEEADRRADAEFTDKLAANEMASASRRHFATLSDEEKVTELDRREDAARERMTAAQSDLADEMAKDVQDRSEARMNRARAEIESAQGEALRAAEEREALQRSIDDDARRAAEDAANAKTREDERANAGRLSRADSFAASFASGGNRLTAMGLGAGADNARTVDEINGKISTVLDVLRQELDAIRGIKQGGAVATFGA